MAIDIFNSGTQSLLNRAMDVTWRSKEVIANNIANVDTPGFKRNEVIYNKNIRKVLQNHNNRGKLVLTNSRHIQGLSSRKDSNVDVEVERVLNTTYRNDGNNVDIDVEMANLTKNNILYEALSQGMTDEIKLLRLAITGRV